MIAYILSDDDIHHYQMTIVALSEAVRIMAEIDEVVESHGGWPNAFLQESTDESYSSKEGQQELREAAEDRPDY